MYGYICKIKMNSSGYKDNIYIMALFQIFLFFFICKYIQKLIHKSKSNLWLAGYRGNTCINSVLKVTRMDLFIHVPNIQSLVGISHSFIQIQSFSTLDNSTVYFLHYQ